MWRLDAAGPLRYGSAMAKGARGSGEKQLVSMLREKFQAPVAMAPVAMGGLEQPPPLAGVALGIGDDAAVLHGLQGALVCSVDVNVEGVHFERNWLSVPEVGFRSFQAAVSDLAAMGAVPVAALSSWIVPPGWEAAQSEALADGLQRAALGCACPIVGGNVSKGAQWSVTTTVLGQVSGPWLRRDAALPGDEVWLAGVVGGAAAGLLALRCWAGRAPSKLAAPGVKQCVEHWRQPRALLTAGQQLVGRARAAVDVSDGLSEDTRQLADASGVRIVLEEGQLSRALAPEVRRASVQLGVSPLRMALRGGEDYCLLATGPASRRPASVVRIGRVSAGRGALLRRRDGRLASLANGFDHLSG